MNNDDAYPVIKPHKMKEYEFKQSKYEVAPKIPFSQIVVGPSGSGKTILLQNMVLDIYRDCFTRVYIFSSSVHVDGVWTPVKKYIENNLKIDTEKEKVYFDDFNPKDLEHILNLQNKITQYQKDHDFKTLYSVLITIDDFVDDTRFSRHNSLLNALYIRGRHFGCNIISSTQKFNGLSTIIRVNSRQLFFFKMRNYKEIQTMIEELSALLVKKTFWQTRETCRTLKNTLLEIYERATEERFSFLFVNLMKSDINEVFMIKFDRKFIVDEDNDGELDSNPDVQLNASGQFQPQFKPAGLSTQQLGQTALWAQQAVVGSRKRVLEGPEIARAVWDETMAQADEDRKWVQRSRDFRASWGVLDSCQKIWC